MRILYVGDRLIHNGRTAYALSLTKGVKEAKADVRFCSTGGVLRSKLHEMKVENFLVKHNVFSFRKLLSYLKEFKADIIHVTSESALAPGRRIARGLGSKYVLTVHELLSTKPLDLHLSELQGVIVGNEGVREFLVNHLNVPKERIRMIVKGVDLNAFDVSTRPFGSNMPVVGCIGRLVAGKGQENFLRAARIVLDAGHRTLFLLVGEGPEEPKLRRILKELNLTEAVTVSPPVRESPEIYRAIDVVVLPAVKATSALTALEGMAARRPVIASVVGDLLHFVKDGENGLAVGKENPEELAQAIGRLLQNPDFARKLGEKARSFVERNYPQYRMIEQTMTLYRDILEGDFPRK